MKDSVGFMTAIESTDHGLIGGLLMLNRLGRPVEFHCTAPVKPSRAHEILYGPTLRSYLIGECMTGAMLTKAKVSPGLILTDLGEVLPARAAIEVPLVLLAGGQEEEGTEVQFALDAETGLWLADCAGFRLQAVSEEDSRVAESLLGGMVYSEWDEPFERIREALAEAQKAVRPSSGGTSRSAA